MVESKSWDWEKNTDGKWTKPAPEAYYLSAVWKQKGYERLLDLGCGLGRHSIFFARQGFRVDAVDLSDYAVSHVRDRAAKENVTIRTKKCDMLRLPFDEGGFDCVLAYNVIYHTDTAGFAAVLREITRVVRPGGALFLTLISKNSASYLNADMSAFIDENSIYRDEGETEKHVPHFYADIGGIYKFFSGYTFVDPPVERRAYDRDRNSVHFVIHAEKRAP